MVRPWHLSRLFWLGAAPLLFLLWAWWYSWQTARVVAFRGGVFGRGELTVASGFIALRRDYNSSEPTGLLGNGSLYESEGDLLSDSQVFAITSWEHSDDNTDPFADPKPTGINVMCRLWIVVVAYLAVLVPVIIVWQRRKRMKWSAENPLN